MQRELCALEWHADSVGRKKKVSTWLERRRCTCTSVLGTGDGIPDGLPLHRLPPTSYLLGAIRTVFPEVVKVKRYRRWLT